MTDSLPSPRSDHDSFSRFSVLNKMSTVSLWVRELSTHFVHPTGLTRSSSYLLERERSCNVHFTLSTLSCSLGQGRLRAKRCTTKLHWWNEIKWLVILEDSSYLIGVQSCRLLESSELITLFLIFQVLHKLKRERVMIPIKTRRLKLVRIYFLISNLFEVERKDTTV